MAHLDSQDPVPDGPTKSEACTRFLQWALPRAGLRWRGYRRVRGTVCKRLNRRLAELGLGDLGAYRRHLGTHPDEWDHFATLCRIPISRFYRDRAVFDALRNSIIPDLAAAALSRRQAALRVWCAGCASGEEVYSLALAWAFELQDRFPRLRLDLLGTDAEPMMIARARRGCYQPGSLKDLPDRWRREGFEQRDHLLCIKQSVRRMGRWTVQDITRRMPDGRFDLICCRNMAFTYFDEAAQTQVLDRLADRITSDGVLVIGAHERLPHDDRLFEPLPGKLPVYKAARATRDRTVRQSERPAVDGSQ